MSVLPTSLQLDQALSLICKVIGQIPVFHLYEKYVSDGLSDINFSEVLKPMIRNAALDSTLVNLRCFDEFFRPGGKSDDIRAHHFQVVSLAPFLGNARQDIDKYVAHLTTIRSDIVTKSWEIDEIVRLGLERGVEFLTQVDKSIPAMSDTTRLELQDVLQVVQHLLKTNKSLNPPAASE